MAGTRTSAWATTSGVLTVSTAGAVSATGATTSAVTADSITSTTTGELSASETTCTVSTAISAAVSTGEAVTASATTRAFLGAGAGLNNASAWSTSSMRFWSTSVLSAVGLTLRVASKPPAAGTLGAGAAFCGNASPRAKRNWSAQAGTSGKGADVSAAASSVKLKAALKAVHTACTCWALVCNAGANLASTLGHWALANKACACAFQRSKSACRPSRKAKASCQGLVDSTSMRCANSTAASRCTWVWCCKSSMALTRSTNAVFNPAKGSRDKGAPALAASRCQPMASAKLIRDASRKASPLMAHSTIKASWSLVRRNSSSFSRRTLAAPLSLLLISLKTACNCSNVG